MAVGGNALAHGNVVAAADLSTKQYRAVAIGSGGVSVASTAGQRTHGILQDTPVANEPACVIFSGIAKAVYGGTVAVDDDLTCDANGKLVTTTSADDYVIARALVSGVSGDVGTVLVDCGRNAQKPSVISIPVTLASITGAGDVLTTYTPGFAGKIVKVSAAVTVAATTASKAATLTCKIGSTSLTGGSLALTSANCTPLGKVNDATSITAANSFTATDTISIVASSVTAFVEGAVVLLLVIR